MSEKPSKAEARSRMRRLVSNHEEFEKQPGYALAVAGAVVEMERFRTALTEEQHAALRKDLGYDIRTGPIGSAPRLPVVIEAMAVKAIIEANQA